MIVNRRSNGCGDRVGVGVVGGGDSCGGCGIVGGGGGGCGDVNGGCGGGGGALVNVRLAIVSGNVNSVATRVDVVGALIAIVINRRRVRARARAWRRCA